MQNQRNDRNQPPTLPGDSQPDSSQQSRKKSRRYKRPPVSTGTNQNSVVNLSSKTLDQHHHSLLDKGLSYCPTPKPNHPCHTLRDVYIFNRRLRLKHHFLDSTFNREKTVYSDFTPSSGWTPPPGKDLYIDSFIGNLNNHITTDHVPQSTAQNLSPEELLALQDLRTDNTVVIKPADKGGSIVILDLKDYIEEGLRQLNNRQHYEPSTIKIYEASTKKIKTYLTNLVQHGMLPPTTHLNLTHKFPRLPSLYLLPKIHKPNNPGRPIISACGGPTENISAFVDATLKPLVSTLPSYVRDTADFLSHIKDVHLADDHTLLTVDVSSLYTNIPHNEGITACEERLSTRPIEEPPTWLITRLLRFILTLNFFEFNGNIYHQVSGTAMGTKMAPNYANIFMGSLEQKLLNAWPTKPVLWLRYIDDIFCIYPDTEMEAQRFVHYLNDQHPTIKFTAEISSDTVHFLDVKVTRSPDNHLHTDLYRKPTDVYRYLHYKSFHPRHHKRAIPYSQFVRVRRICTAKKDYFRHSDNMIANMHQRGYPMKLLLEAQTKAGALRREDLITTKATPTTDKNIPLIVTFDPHHHHISEGVNNAKFLLDNVKPPLTSTRLLVTFRRNNNLRDNLVHSQLKRTSKPRKFIKCCRPRCQTCPHVRETNVVENPHTGKKLRITTHADCTSYNVIYLIQCRKCGKQYVGQTSNTVHTRFQQHIRDIKTSNSQKTLPLHYTSPNHTGADAMLTVVDSASQINERLRLEEAWITCLGSLQPAGLNAKW